jgi:PAS domain S-box-containing protein
MSEFFLSSPSSAGSSAFDADTAAWFFAQSLDLFLVTEEDGTIVQVNPAWSRVMGWAPERLIGHRLYEFLHPDEIETLRVDAAKARQEGVAQGVFRIRDSAGDWRWVSGRSHCAENGRLMSTLRDVTDERIKMAEVDGLRRTHALVADTAGIAAWTLDPVTRAFHYPYETSRLGTITGTTAALDTFDALQNLVVENDWVMLRDWFEQARRQGGEGDLLVRFVTHDGSHLHFQINYRSEPHPSGLFTIHGLSQNVTAAMEARDAARRGERMTRQMIQAAPFAAAMFDQNLQHLVVSDAWCSILGLTEKTVIGRTLDELFPKARRRFIAAQKRALAGETVRRPEDQLISQDGQLLWVRWEMQPWRDAEGKISGVLAYLSDVSALVAAKREAQSSARRLKLAVNAAKAAVFEVDFAEKTVWHGPGFAKLAGHLLTFKEMLGVWSNVHPDDMPYMRELMAGFDTRCPQPFECRLVHPDGSARWIRAHVEIFHDALGRPRRSVGLLLDIDQRKKQELALAEAERQATVATEAKSRFLANISHEIRTPMNGVLGVLQLISRDRLNVDDIQLLDEGLASGRMLTELLDDLLDFSKIETGQFELHPEPLDPAQVLVGITSLLQPAASAKGLTMRATADPDLGLINADPLRLRQALYNIMGNAVKFTPSGSVEARLSRVDTPDGPRLRFEVQDTGVGVPEAAQATLFERFEQADNSMGRQFGGTGLGLAITKRLAEMMGGAVGFSSEPGQGSTFWMEIGGDEVAPTAANEEDADVGEFRVLLVEDNPTNRLVISKLLQALGITVECAEDGEAGVAAAAKGGYDMVLMDIQMPGMDGMEATRRIRAMEGPISTTPVVAITANVLAEQKSNYAAAGMDGVVSKPVSAAALISEITRVTELRAA